MIADAHQKVRAEHLARKAYLYVRQSTMRQVVENQESTKRQYDLSRRAVALGWHQDQIVTIDQDLGQSAASSDRVGFQKLVAEVGMDRAGIVMGLEVSRLARNSSDWHRLLEICAVTDTLILDEEGVYDPAHFNDRLLLGLKGTMSEAELHVIRARLMGGLLNKAQRGELCMRLPVGFVYDEQDRVMLNPDKQIRECLHLFFRTFRRVGTIYRTVQMFREQNLKFPKRMHFGPCKGKTVWSLLTYSRAYEILHNPRYAGAFVYGRRTEKRVGADGRLTTVYLPREKWRVLIPRAHEGYIKWEDYEENQKRLEANRHWKRACPPREGPALLQGLVICGVCGRKMSVRYHHRWGGLNPDYCCDGQGKKVADSKCQSIPGYGIDEAVGDLLVQAMNPIALEVSLAVQQELQERIEEADQLRCKQLERARYESELTRQRFMRVSPDNRLVADSLEADWNIKLKLVAEAEEHYKRHREQDRKVLDEETRARIMALASDFPRLWKNPSTPIRERKRMARLLIEDVTLLKGEDITAHVRFKGGKIQTIHLPRPLSYFEKRKTDAAVVVEIDRLLSTHTTGEVADELNRQGHLSGDGHPFDSRRVIKLIRAYGLKPRYDRLRETGLLTAAELAERFGVRQGTIRNWLANGRFRAYRVNDTGQHLFEDPGPSVPDKAIGRRKGTRGAE